MEVSSPADLVAAAAGNDRVAWRAIVERYERLLWAIARGHRLQGTEAGDVVQTTWLRLVENLGRIRDPDHLGAWLATTARRECLRTIRSRARDTPVDPSTIERVDELARPVDADLLDRERAEALWRSFGQLSTSCQQLLRVLMSSPTPSYEEVSQALGLPIGSIGPTRGRCLQRLRGLVGDADEFV